ncbi:hypothetical protein A3SI_09583 [Nitritalea halalkaliphila LW7]|uniref:Uncharacterized protein n=2 Tax=Nitritalea TaxID=1187887 RepID=I5C4D8_9BACT|nr:hypothetical protein A3SI_09583 [Nitritalea halalkaliphila LW7]
MYLRVFMAFGVLLMSVWACQPQASSEEKKIAENEALRDEVIAVHDEVMPYMDELKALKRKVLADAESGEGPLSAEEAEDLATELDAAFDGMFAWMRQFKVKNDEMSPEEVEEYLNDQMAKVRVVHEQITRALQKGREATGSDKANS